MEIHDEELKIRKPGIHDEKNEDKEARNPGIAHCTEFLNSSFLVHGFLASLFPKFLNSSTPVHGFLGFLFPEFLNTFWFPAKYSIFRWKILSLPYLLPPPFLANMDLQWRNGYFMPGERR